MAGFHQPECAPTKLGPFMGIAPKQVNVFIARELKNQPLCRESSGISLANMLRPLEKNCPENVQIIPMIHLIDRSSE